MSNRVTFAEFMRAALYDETHGYYMSEREHFGSSGDFNTTSQYHELFAQIMVEEFANTFHALGSPAQFTIVELGPGNGDFALQTLTELRLRVSEVFARLRYVCCEISPWLRQRQEALLDEFADRVTWISSLAEIVDPLVGVFFSNEFFDSLPTHVIRQRGSELLEVYVSQSDNGARSFVEDCLSNARLGEYWERAGTSLADGQLAEINLAAVDCLQVIAKKLAAGSVITVDYGDFAGRLYTTARPEGTLRCFAGHRLGDAPLERIGEQDLTASVNFSALIEYGSDNGLRFVSFDGLPDYLVRNGLLERTAEASRKEDTGNIRSLTHRLALKQLFVPHGIAAHFKVLVQEKEP